MYYAKFPLFSVFVFFKVVIENRFPCSLMFRYHGFGFCNPGIDRYLFALSTIIPQPEFENITKFVERYYMSHYYLTMMMHFFFFLTKIDLRVNWQCHINIIE
jgi:hypothetical protein